MNEEDNNLTLDQISKLWQISNIELIEETPIALIYCCLYENSLCIMKAYKHIKENNLNGTDLYRLLPNSSLPTIYKRNYRYCLMEKLIGSQLSQHPRTIRPSIPGLFVHLTKPFHQIKHRPRKTNQLSDLFKPLFDNNTQNIEQHLFNESRKRCRFLLDTQNNLCLLHGDLHHGNIIGSPENGWRIIDPKPIYGERTYDFANSFYNPETEFTTISETSYINKISEEYESLTGINKKRILEFAFVHGVLSSVWFLEDGEECKNRLIIASRILNLI